MKKSLVLALTFVFVLSLTPATFAVEEAPTKAEQTATVPAEPEAATATSCEAPDVLEWAETVLDAEAVEPEACWPYECSGPWCWEGVRCVNHCCV